MNIPQLSDDLTQEHISFLQAFSQSTRHSIISMVANAQSGHPGGSLSCVDFLSLLYSFIISQTGEKVIVSNGHISPAVYAVLAEMGYIPKKEVIQGFRKVGYVYEGHVTRHVPGVWYGTGPLGAGISAASGFALAEKLKKTEDKVYALVGDGESQEGQVYEMMNFASKYALSNFIVWMDYNRVQLSDSLDAVMPMDFSGHFTAAGWEVIEVDGHDFNAQWRALRQAHSITDKPILLLASTIMGKGVDFMEETGRAYKADWHGKAPKKEQADEVLARIVPSPDQQALIQSFQEQITWKPGEPAFTKALTPTNMHTGTPTVYEPGEKVDCRSGYGNALRDLGLLNDTIVALTADLGGSVKTDTLRKQQPEKVFDVGVAEQQMVSCSGGLSLNGFTPFCSTFGAFMSSRAKDQARVNDINEANVKMVATHCGLSVGEDGPTHQAIDDMGSMLGLLNTMVVEPADANHTDRIIRYVASHYGNFYVRMGRHKLPILTKTDGSPFYDADYTYEYGRCDALRRGEGLTLAASGSMASIALEAWEQLKIDGFTIDLIVVSSPKKFNATLYSSIEKTGKVVTVEDHNVRSGFGSQLAREILLKNIPVHKMDILGVKEYQLSGDAFELYDEAGIGAKGITKACRNILS